MLIDDVVSLDNLYWTTSLLQVRIFLLFMKKEDQDIVDLGQLFSTAISVLDIFAQLDQKTQLALYCPTYALHAILLAAGILLKLLKGYALDCIDFDVGSAAYFSALEHCKKASVQGNDVAAKGALIMSELWSSDKIYTYPDGSPRLAFQVRNRLAASITFDNLWWHRELANNPLYNNELSFRQQSFDEMLMDDSLLLLDVDWVNMVAQ